MSLFQKSVEKKYLNDLDPALIDKKYADFQNYFGNTERQENIRNSKEEQFQEGFLRELFVNILGYTLNPEPDFNLTTELKNISNSKKADGAILKKQISMEHAPLIFAHAVIELKSTNTTDLDSIETQAFGYKNHHPKCVYVITSNFEKLRFYIQNAVDHIDFDLFKLTKEQFSLLWLCLAKDNLLNDLPLKIKDSSVLQEENITKKLYADYSTFRVAIYNNLIKNNPDKDKLLLFKKTQKLLDRFLFIFFAEDRLLVPPNSISRIIEKWKDDVDFGDARPLYHTFQRYFHVLNVGRPKSGNRQEIFAYNGGLFKPDKILDNITIDDNILYEHTLRLSNYNFETEVDVNILGHIFEHSLGDIENVQAEIKGEKVDNQKTKRKKDGIFYTPKYITKYIVENTLGKLCIEKRAELNIVDEEYAKGRKNRKKDIVKTLDKKLDEYRNWLLTLTILDPACGSGAFLNQALEFLITEHRKIDELRAQLFGGAIVFSNITTNILEKNIFGVDINEESVDIAKLSLWLRTAQKGRKLNTLSNNIKCGNSLIDDPKVAGEKAFNWQKEFPDIFQKKEKKAWHITTATHNSRYSQRMFDNYVKLGEPVWLNEKEEIIVSETIAEIAKKDKLNIISYNICGDHMHMLLVCEEEELPKIVQKIKSMSARACNIAMGRTIPLDQATEHAPSLDPRLARGKTQNHLWTQKFGQKEITSEGQLQNTIEYIRNNRIKHGMDESSHSNIGACSDAAVEHAFRTEYTGGFDVVIGNPPWGAKMSTEELKYIKAQQKEIIVRMTDSFMFFVDKSLSINAKGGWVGLIVPDVILYQKDNEKLRKKILENASLTHAINVGDGIFEDVARPSAIIIIKNKICNDARTFVGNFNKRIDLDIFFINNNIVPQDLFTSLPNTIFATREIQGYSLLNRLSSNKLKSIIDEDGIQRGISPDYKNAFIVNMGTINTKELEKSKIKRTVTGGVDVKRYNILDKDKNILYISKWDDVNEFPNIISHLSEYKNKITCTEVKQGKHPFYALHRARKEEIFLKKEKIIGVITGDKIITSVDESQLYPTDGLYLMSINKQHGSNKALVCILNSKLITYLYRLISSENNRAMAQIKPVLVSELPIVIPDNNIRDKFEYLHDIMSNGSKEIYRILFIFINYVIHSLEIDLTKKLKNWHELTGSEFLKELNKAIKKTGNEKLSKSDEMEWMEVFENKKAEAKALKSEIDKTDKKIDQMVYKLYGLTEEEIKIIENS